MNQSVVPHKVLTVTSWPMYRFLSRQVRRSGIPVCFRIFHSLLWSTQSSPARTPKLQLDAEQPLAGECWNPPKKDTPHPRQDSRRGAIPFKIKPHTHQRGLEGTNKTLCAPGPRERSSEPHKKMSQISLWVFQSRLWNHASDGLPQGQGLCQQHSWEAQVVVQVPLEDVTINPTIEPSGGWSTNRRTITPKKISHCCKISRPHNRLPNLGIQQRGWESPENVTLKVSRIWLQYFHRTGGKEVLEGQKQNLVHTSTQEKGAVSP